MAIHWPQAERGPFGNKALNAVLLGLALFILLSAFFWYIIVAQDPDDFNVVEIAYGWDGADGDATRLWSDVTFENPHRISVTLERVDYEYRVNGRALASERIEPQDVLPARSERTVRLPIEWPTGQITEWFAGHVANGERTELTLLGRAGFRLAGENLTLPFRFDAEWKTSIAPSLEEVHNCPQAYPDPCIESVRPKWQQRGSEWVLSATLRLQNPHQDDLILRAPAAELYLNGKVTGTSEPVPDTQLEAAGETPVTFIISVLPERLLAWWPEHVARCESSAASASVRFEPVVVPGATQASTTTHTPPTTSHATTTSPPSTASTQSTATSSSESTPTSSSTTTSSTTTSSSTTTTASSSTTSSTTSSTSSTSTSSSTTSSSTSSTSTSTSTSSTTTTTSSSSSTTTTSETLTSTSSTSVPTTSAEASGPPGETTAPEPNANLRVSSESRHAAADPSGDGIVSWSFSIDRFQTAFVCTHDAGAAA